MADPAVSIERRRKDPAFLAALAAYAASHGLAEPHRKNDTAS